MTRAFTLILYVIDNDGNMREVSWDESLSSFEWGSVKAQCDKLSHRADVKRKEYPKDGSGEHIR